MKWEEVLKLFRGQPVIETFMLGQNPKDLPKIRVQISRWVNSGRLLKIRNGLYALSESYAISPADNEYISTFAIRPSYISLDSALASYGMIPENVPNITLITTKRPQKIEFQKTRFIYRHISPRHFWGYVSRGKKNFETFVAEPEKALLDKFYFTYDIISAQFFRDSMRLQNTEVVDLAKLVEYAKRFESPKMVAAAELFCKFAAEERGYKTL